MTVKGTVTSGIAVHTTLGNCLRNLLVWKFCFKKCRTPNLKVAVLGDDTIISGRKEELETLRSRYQKVFITKPLSEMKDPERYGCGIRVDTISEPNKISEFCSKMVIKRADHYVLGRDPRKAILGTKYSSNNEDIQDVLTLFKI